MVRIPLLDNLMKAIIIRRAYEVPHDSPNKNRGLLMADSVMFGNLGHTQQALVLELADRHG